MNPAMMSGLLCQTYCGCYPLGFEASPLPPRLGDLAGGLSDRTGQLPENNKTMVVKSNSKLQVYNTIQKR